MPTASMLMTLLVETILHPGAGQSVSAIDLPIQRERHTGFPVIPASILKGCLRAAVEEHYGNPSDIVTAIFGSADTPAPAGALQMFDARLLALPIRSLQQVLVWVTCPLILLRLKRDVALVGMISSLPIPDVTVTPGQAQVITGSLLVDSLALEDMRFTVEASCLPTDLVTTINSLAPQQIGADWTQRLAVIADGDFAHLVTHTIPVTVHVAITPWSKVNNQCLWYKETLPPKTLLYAIMRAGKPKDDKRAVIGQDDVLAKTGAVFAGFGEHWRFFWQKSGKRKSD